MGCYSEVRLLGKMFRLRHNPIVHHQCTPHNHINLYHGLTRTRIAILSKFAKFSLFPRFSVESRHRPTGGRWFTVYRYRGGGIAGAIMWDLIKVLSSTVLVLIPLGLGLAFFGFVLGLELCGLVNITGKN